ncbi:hypothetical protein AAMO2058_000399900 [Amorphochlora amoebiformis]
MIAENALGYSHVCRRTRSSSLLRRLHAVSFTSFLITIVCLHLQYSTVSHRLLAQDKAKQNSLSEAWARARRGELTSECESQSNTIDESTPSNSPNHMDYSHTVDAGGRAMYCVDTIRGLEPGHVDSIRGLEPGQTHHPQQFKFPLGITTDNEDRVYVCDTYNHQIKMLSKSVENKTLRLSLIAGCGHAGYADGPAESARFCEPCGIAVGDRNRNVYVTDRGNCALRMITPRGQVHTVAGRRHVEHLDGCNPHDTFHQQDDSDEQTPLSEGRRVGRGVFGPEPQPPLLLSYLDGTGTMATFRSMDAVALVDDDTLFVLDSTARAIRRLRRSPGDTVFQVTTLTGGRIGYMAQIGGPSDWSCSTDGPPGSAYFINPSGIATDRNNFLYVGSRAGEHNVRKINFRTRVTKTLAGSRDHAGDNDGSRTEARFRSTQALAYSQETGNVYVVDGQSLRVREISPDGNVKTVGGSGSMGWADGMGTQASFGSPRCVCIPTSQSSKEQHDMLILDSLLGLVRRMSIPNREDLRQRRVLEAKYRRRQQPETTSDSDRDVDTGSTCNMC